MDCGPALAYDALRYTDFPSLNIGLMVQADHDPLITPAALIRSLSFKPAVWAIHRGARGSKSRSAAPTWRPRTSAEWEDELVISGQSLWITNGAIADSSCWPRALPRAYRASRSSCFDGREGLFR
jgi:hypothetical protein